MNPGWSGSIQIQLDLKGVAYWSLKETVEGMGAGPEDRDSDEISITLPTEAVEELIEGSPSALSSQDAIKRAIDTQIEIDTAASYTITKRGD